MYRKAAYPYGGELTVKNPPELVTKQDNINTYKRKPRLKAGLSH